ncbi:hypothetical protein FV139_04925 [Parahaliea maris]|uniref:PepSY domain-containing protein n=1 Tax=Parahaliea maris TaxID=2716870 RepID=A0A5C9A3F7_9GAMM|nr:hypothetical protein [Parahaliea maris]TXS95246.1 hypothetical protein FV139_04925 [Parahaliea maris]
MNGARLSRKVHKWLSLAVGLQLLIWAASGFYMVAVRIDIIHGDMLVSNMATPVAVADADGATVAGLLQRYPDATGITLDSLAGEAVYRLDTPAGQRLVNAGNGESLPPLDEASALSVARYHYADSGEVTSVEYINRNPPSEIGALPLPVWRVNFDDRWGTSFYILPDSGRFATRRHTLWRIFDFLWMLHIMDYEERENVNNRLLQGVSVAALMFAASGTWLLLYSFRRPRRERPA